MESHTCEISAHENCNGFIGSIPNRTGCSCSCHNAQEGYGN